MFRFVLFAWSLLASWLVVGVAVAAEKDDGGYRLNPGDTVLISVWREEALQREVRVLPDGSVTFPLAGRVDVAGVGSPEAAKRIATRLKDYIPDPIVTVVITNTDGNRAHVLGKVARPGPVVMNGNMLVLQALSMAGGLDKFADEGAIKIVRGQEILPVNYKDLISGRDMTTNFQLKAGDTIVVP